MRRRPEPDDGMPKDWLFSTIGALLLLFIVIGTAVGGYFLLKAIDEVGEGMGCSNIDAPADCID